MACAPPSVAARSSTAPTSRGARIPVPGESVQCGRHRPADPATETTTTSRCRPRWRCPRRVRRDGRLVEPDHGVRPRAQRDRRPALPQHRPVARRHVDAVGDVAVGSEHAELVDELRSHSEPKPSSRSAWKLAGRRSRHGSASPCSRSNAASPSGCAATPPARARCRGSPAAARRRASTARARQAGPGRRGQRVQPRLDLGPPPLGPRGVGPAHHLPVGDAVQPRIVQRGCRLDVGDDVGHRGRAGGDHLRGARPGIHRPIQARLVDRWKAAAQSSNPV